LADRIQLNVALAIILFSDNLAPECIKAAAKANLTATTTSDKKRRSQ